MSTSPWVDSQRAATALTQMLELTREVISSEHYPDGAGVAALSLTSSAFYISKVYAEPRQVTSQ
jgi:hypothetical protein